MKCCNICLPTSGLNNYTCVLLIINAEIYMFSIVEFEGKMIQANNKSDRNLVSCIVIYIYPFPALDNHVLILSFLFSS